MQASKSSLSFKKALFPAIMTTISFVLFIVVYLLVTMRSINPYYLEGLIFGLPFILFGLITFFTARGQLKNVTSILITVILIIVMGIGSFLTFIFISIDAATTETRDIGKYERVLKLKNYPKNFLIENFPNEIPNNGENISFGYNPAFLQGGEILGLRFQTDSNSIDNYTNEFSKKAKWIGKSGDVEVQENGIFLNSFEFLGYEYLPKDFKIYVIYSKAYKPGDWNHGEFSLVAINKQKDEIIFLMEDW